MKKVQLIYVGRRINADNKMFHAYQDAQEGPESVNVDYYKKSIGYFAIGTIIEAEKTETGVKGPYVKIGMAPNKDITRYSIADRNAFQRKVELADAKKKAEGDVETLIDAVKENTMTSAERRRIAMYIFNRITS